MKSDRSHPYRHWTDSKIRVYALIAVLALLVLKLLLRTVEQENLGMSAEVFGSELADVQVIHLQMAPGNIRRMLTEQSTVQRQLVAVLGLERYAQVAPNVTVHLHTNNA